MIYNDKVAAAALTLTCTLLLKPIFSIFFLMLLLFFYLTEILSENKIFRLKSHFFLYLFYYHVIATNKYN